MGIAGEVRSWAADVPTNGSATLGSWKEIAAYLGKGVRTVQRWEDELSLPIRRPIEHNTRIVIAVPAELDAWIQRQSTKNSTHGSQFAPRGDGIFRARLARLTETLQQLDGSMRHLQLTADQLVAEQRHGRELLAALRKTRSLAQALRQARLKS